MGTPHGSTPISPHCPVHEGVVWQLCAPPGLLVHVSPFAQGMPHRCHFPVQSVYRPHVTFDGHPGMQVVPLELPLEAPLELPLAPSRELSPAASPEPELLELPELPELPELVPELLPEPLPSSMVPSSPPSPVPPEVELALPQACMAATGRAERRSTSPMVNRRAVAIFRPR